jgi:hypothetical protein
MPWVDAGRPGADQSHAAAAIEDHLGHARRVTRTVVVEHDDPLADGPELVVADERARPELASRVTARSEKLAIENVIR